MKKVSSDKHETVFEHEEGHRMVVKHRALSPTMKRRVTGMPIGVSGERKEPKKDTKRPDEHTKDSKKTVTASPIKASDTPVKMAEGGEVPIQLDPSQMQLNMQMPPQASEQLYGVPENPMAVDRPYGTPAPLSMLAPQQLPNTPQEALAASPAQPPSDAPLQQPQQPNQPVGMAGAFQDLNRQGYGLEMQAIEGKRLADTSLGTQVADLAADQAKASLGNMAKYQKQQEQIAHERQGLIHDVENGHIKPNQLWENTDTPKKVMATIGLMLGGFGAAFTGGQNMALEYLNKQIDRDIDAQKANLSNKHTLLSNNMAQFKNINDAEAVTRAQYNDLFIHMIDQAKAGNVSQQAKATADMAKGQLMQQNALLLSSVGSSGSGNQIDDYLSILRVKSPEMAKEIESRYIPGVGLASIPICEKQRSEVTERQSLQHEIAKLKDWSKAHTGTLNPSDRAYGESLAKQVQDRYRAANGQGVFKESEAHFVSGVLGDNPTSFLNKWTTDPKLRAAMESNQGILNSLYKNLGIKTTLGGSPMQGSGFQPKSFTPAKR